MSGTLASVSIARPCGLRLELARLSLELSQVQALRIDARQLGQALLQQRLQTHQFVAHDLCLRLDGLGLRGQAFDLLTDLIDTLAQLRNLALAGAPPCQEQVVFDVEASRQVRARERHGLHQGSGVSLKAGFRGRRRELDRRQVFAFGHEPRRAHLLAVELHHDDAELGACLGFVHSHQQIAGGNLLAVAHEDGGDAAAVLMLDAADIALDDNVARRNHRAANLHGGRVAENAEQRRSR